MFTIIGGDGKEYGPVSADQIRSWIAAGRANLQTQAKAIGSDQWQRLGDFPEFAGPAVPPIIGGLDPTLADRGVRLLAALLDWVFSMIVAVPGAVMYGFTALRALSDSAANGSIDESVLAGNVPALATMGVGMFALVIVQIWLISTRGQTLGKMIFGIRIVRADNGQYPGFLRGWLLRNFVPGIVECIPFLGGFFFLVDVCFIFGAERRCLHDLIAGTRVVEA